MKAASNHAADVRAVNDTVDLGIAARAVLADIGVEVEEPEPDTFDRLISSFGRHFPTTIQLSAYARDTLPDVDPAADPDGALVAWMEHEEALFRHLEREIVSDRLQTGFFSVGQADVDGFLSFSLSVQRRRKSRAGYAFGHHVEAILQAHKISYTREATTEKRNAADFLFPGENEYVDRGYLPFVAPSTKAGSGPKSPLPDLTKDWTSFFDGAVLWSGPDHIGQPLRPDLRALPGCRGDVAPALRDRRTL